MIKKKITLPEPLGYYVYKGNDPDQGMVTRGQ